MPTSYGIVTIQFPGFPAIQFNTVERYAKAPGSRNYHRRTFLPSRKVVTTDGRTLRLSCKERSRLRTLLKKWNHHRGYESRGRRVRSKESYRTSGEEWDCYA